MKKILIVEDDSKINEMINLNLSKEGYSCVSAFSGTEAELLLKSQCFDLIILDLMLPGKSGEAFLGEVRKESKVPVIVLSAKDELDTKVDLLTLGADDYMTKPFALKELKARVLVQLRKQEGTGQEMSLSYRDLRLDAEKKLLFVAGEPERRISQGKNPLPVIFAGKIPANYSLFKRNDTSLPEIRQYVKKR